MLVHANLTKDIKQECIAKQKEKGEEKGWWRNQWRLIERQDIWPSDSYYASNRIGLQEVEF